MGKPEIHSPISRIQQLQQVTEIYFGHRLTRDRLGNIENFQPDETISYTIAHNNNSTNFKPNNVYLEGQWKNNPDNIEL